MPTYHEMYDYILNGLKERRVQDPYGAVKQFDSEGLIPNQGWVQSRSTSSPYKHNGYEDSWGPLQMYRGGMGGDYIKATGENWDNVRAGKNWQRAVDYGLDRLVQDGWGPWYGPKNKYGTTGRMYIGDAATPTNKWKDESMYDNPTAQRLLFDQLVMAGSPNFPGQVDENDPFAGMVNDVRPQQIPMDMATDPGGVETAQASFDGPTRIGDDDRYAGVDAYYDKQSKSYDEENRMLGRFAPAARMIGSALFQMGTGMRAPNFESTFANEQKLGIDRGKLDAARDASRYKYDMASKFFLEKMPDDPARARNLALLYATGGIEAKDLDAFGLGAVNSKQGLSSSQAFAYQRDDGSISYVMPQLTQGGAPVFYDWSTREALDGLPPNAIPVPNRTVTGPDGTYVVSDFKLAEQMLRGQNQPGPGAQQPAAPGAQQPAAPGVQQPAAPASVPSGAPGTYFIPKNNVKAEQDKALGQSMGERYGEADSDRSKALGIVRNIEGALQHPGRKKFSGASWGDYGEQLWGGLSRDEDYLDYKNRVAPKLTGSVFVEGFQSVKGAGQITEYEGKTAAEAIENFNQNQSDASYEDALWTFYAIQLWRIKKADAIQGITSDPYVNQRWEMVKQKVPSIAANLEADRSGVFRGKIGGVTANPGVDFMESTPRKNESSGRFEFVD